MPIWYFETFYETTFEIFIIRDLVHSQIIYAYIKDVFNLMKSDGIWHGSRTEITYNYDDFKIFCLFEENIKKNSWFRINVKSINIALSFKCHSDVPF